MFLSSTPFKCPFCNDPLPYHWPLPCWQLRSGHLCLRICSFSPILCFPLTVVLCGTSAPHATHMFVDLTLIPVDVTPPISLMPLTLLRDALWPNGQAFIFPFQAAPNLFRGNSSLVLTRNSAREQRCESDLQPPTPGRESSLGVTGLRIANTLFGMSSWLGFCCSILP